MKDKQFAYRDVIFNHSLDSEVISGQFSVIDL